MGVRPRMHHIATAAVGWIVAVSCSSPTTPDVPLVADVSVAPPTKIAAIVSAPPFRWRASWTVNVQTPEVAGGGEVFASVRARVEHQDGRALAELAENPRPLGGEAGIEGRIARFAQTAIYQTPATPPTSSRLVITVQLSDRRGRVEEMTRVDAILEYLCGLKGQIGCEGATIELADAGASPRQATIAFGQKVMYLNRHAGAHRISSDLTQRIRIAHRSTSARSDRFS